MDSHRIIATALLLGMFAGNVSAKPWCSEVIGALPDPGNNCICYAGKGKCQSSPDDNRDTFQKAVSGVTGWVGQTRQAIRGTIVNAVSGAVDSIKGRTPWCHELSQGERLNGAKCIEPEPPSNDVRTTDVHATLEDSAEAARLSRETLQSAESWIQDSLKTGIARAIHEKRERERHREAIAAQREIIAAAESSSQTNVVRLPLVVDDQADTTTGPVNGSHRFEETKQEDRSLSLTNRKLLSRQTRVSRRTVQTIPTRGNPTASSRVNYAVRPTDYSRKARTGNPCRWSGPGECTMGQ